MGGLASGGISLPTCTSSAWTLAYFMIYLSPPPTVLLACGSSATFRLALQPHDCRSAHEGDDVVLGIGDRGLADDEGHGPGLAGLFVDVGDAEPAEIVLARPDRLEVLELLLAVEEPADVHAQVAQERAGVAALVAEGDREGGRRDDVAPRPRLGDLVVQVEGREVADRAGELLDLAALDGDGVGRVLLALDRRVDLNGHQILRIISPLTSGRSGRWRLERPRLALRPLIAVLILIGIRACPLSWRARGTSRCWARGSARDGPRRSFRPRRKRRSGRGSACRPSRRAWPWPAPSSRAGSPPGASSPPRCRRCRSPGA